MSLFSNFFDKKATCGQHYNYSNNQSSHLNENHLDRAVNQNLCVIKNINKKQTTNILGEISPVFLSPRDEQANDMNELDFSEHCGNITSPNILTSPKLGNKQPNYCGLYERSQKYRQKETVDLMGSIAEKSGVNSIPEMKFGMPKKFAELERRSQQLNLPGNHRVEQKTESSSSKEFLFACKRNNNEKCLKMLNSKSLKLKLEITDENHWTP